MSYAARRTTREILFSILVGSLVALALLPVANAQEIAPLPAVGPLDGFSAFFAGTLPGLAVAAAAVAVFLAAARKSFRRWLAPTPATDLSRALNMVLALALGVPMGLLGVAPAVPAGSVAGNVVGGIVAASLAVLFRQLLVWGLRAKLGAKGGPDADEITPAPKAEP